MVSPPKQTPKAAHRLLVRGESVIASTGLALAAILMISLAAAAGWSVYVQRLEAQANAQSRLEVCGRMLAQTLEPMLAAREDSAARSLLASAAIDHGLLGCRLVLADETVFIDAMTKVAVRRTMPDWPEGTPAQPPADRDGKLLAASFPVTVSGRGEARLELAGQVRYPAWAGWEARAGIGVIGVSGFLALLLVYRRLRSRVGAMGAIRESLLAMRAGDSAAKDLAVNPRLGAEAVIWNGLLDELARMRTDRLSDRARETLGSRRDLKSDLANACDALWQGMVVVDEQLKIKYVNGAASVFLRVKREELLSASLGDHVTEPSLLDAIRRVSGTGSRRRTTVEVRRTEQEGGGVLRYSIRPVRRDDAAGAVIMIEDVTQQRVADEARNGFVAQVTHELRTPLTNIRLYVEQAIEAGEADNQLRSKCLNIINIETRRLERVVGDMLSVSEIEAGSFKLRTDDVRLDALFETLRADYLASAADKSIALTFDLPPKLPVIMGDRDKIMLAMHNLVGNAIKYTPKGGSVVVRVREEGDGLEVEVVDSGIGIKDDEHELIFEKFYRAKDQRLANITGSGLGLALAREVVRLHGGDISVKSQLNQGSTFTLTLPARAEAA